MEPVVERFSASRGALTGAVLLALFLGLGLLLAFKEESKMIRLSFIVPLLLADGLYIAYLATYKLALTQGGLACSSLFGRFELQWEDVERLHFAARKMHFHSIPIGISYRLKLVRGDGHGIVLRLGIDRLAELSKLVVAYTTPVLLGKLMQRYNRAEELDFGSVRLHSVSGLSVKSLLRSATIPLAELTVYRIDRGRLNLRKSNEIVTIEPLIRDMPNAFALIAMLDQLLNRKTAGAASIIDSGSAAV